MMTNMKLFTKKFSLW